MAMAAACIGGLVGLASGVLNERKRLGSTESMRVKLPTCVLQQPDLLEAIMALSETKKPDLPALERVARRVKSLLDLLSEISAAEPKSIERSLSATASQMQNSVRLRLREYYLSSDILLSQDEGKGDFKPLGPAPRRAHEFLAEFVEALVHDVHMTVNAKRDEALGPK